MFFSQESGRVLYENRIKSQTNLYCCFGIKSLHWTFLTQQVAQHVIRPNFAAIILNAFPPTFIATLLTIVEICPMNPSRAVSISCQFLKLLWVISYLENIMWFLKKNFLSNIRWKDLVLIIPEKKIYTHFFINLII